MAKRITPSQFKSKMRQIQSKQRQAINNYNQAVRKHNQDVNRAINKYNQEVRTHNTKVRANRQRLQSALNRLKSQSTVTTLYTTFHTSVNVLNERYVFFDQYSAPDYVGTENEEIIDLVDRENANNIEVMDSLLAERAVPVQNERLLQSTIISNELINILPDLDARWRGAIFSLSPDNPDASRHFCTSARELFTLILDIKAPKEEVLALFPTEITDQGIPSRRAKIKYLLHKRGLDDQALEEFIEEDMNNIIQLFRMFNDGTHGTAGKFNIDQLIKIKTRVEDGILFLSKIVN